MSDRLFLTLFLAIPVLFVVLDGVELSRACARRERADRMGWEALGFFALVLVVYGAIQFGGFALVPSTERIIAAVRDAVGARLGSTLPVDTIRGVPLALLTLAMFYVSGLWDYLLHRFFSHSRRFFFTHEYHHLPNDVNLLMPGLAVRPFSIITSFPATIATVVSAYAILLMLGLPLWNVEPLKGLLLIQAFLLTASHSCFLRNAWWLHNSMKWLALTTPQEHLLHHTVEMQGNYGNFTVLWDRIFRTYLDPTRAEHRNPTIGLGYDQDFLGAITAGKLKLPSAVRRRFEVGRFCNLKADDYDLATASETEAPRR
jgi:sterol desaturase/sphingolipid hydroxylase (fatty acid hydroxylase superfamily)